MSGRLPRTVLHVMNGTGGGAALSTLGLIAELARHGVRSSVACNGDGPQAEHEAIRDAVEGRVLFTPLYWWNRKTRAKKWKRPLLEAIQVLKTGATLSSTARVAQFARRQQAELIHSNTSLTLEGGGASALLGLPHVWHVRELVGTLFEFPLEGQVLGNFVAARASAVVANSEASAAPWRPLLPPGLLTVVPNGLDLEPFTALDRKPGRSVVVAMVANLASRSKKHALFLDACAQANAKAPVEFRLYGAVPAAGSDAYADRVVAGAAEAGVEVMGFCEATQALAEVDVLVHTADQESFGRTIVEAMAAGLPVVGVRGGGILETVVDGKTGLLADVDDATGLARAIERLVNDPELRQAMGSAGRARARAQFSIEACGAGVAQVYRRAMMAPLNSPLGIFPLVLDSVR